MPDALSQLRDALENSGKHAAVATVEAIDAAVLTCDVILEGEEITRENVPLRIFNDDGGFGMAFVPRIGSDVLITFIDGVETRPQVVKVQEWDWLVLRRGELEIVISPDNAISIQKGSGFEFTLTAEDTFLMGNSPTHSIIHGDKFLPLHNYHRHATPNGISSWPIYQVQDEDCISDIFIVE